MKTEHVYFRSLCLERKRTNCLVAISKGLAWEEGLV